VTRTREEARARAAEALARAQAPGADFAKLAAQYSDEPGAAATGGNVGTFAPGQMDPKFEEAVRALEPGKIGPSVVETPFGFHVVRRNPL
jgi:peptidyl-prolyl cis-trans isomerase D